VSHARSPLGAEQGLCPWTNRRAPTHSSRATRRARFRRMGLSVRVCAERNEDGFRHYTCKSNRSSLVYFDPFGES
jgi:hypothetical protein